MRGPSRGQRRGGVLLPALALSSLAGVQEVKNTKTLQSKSPALGFTASPLPYSILLQPLRLNRNSPQWADPETTRTAVTKSRAYWAACLSLAKLTVADFRLHLASVFRHLPFDEGTRKPLCRRLTPVPDSPLFWQAVEDADRIIRDAEKNPQGRVADIDVWNGQYFRTCFAGQPKALSQSWGQCGLDVLFILDVLRTRATAHVNQRSRPMRFFWERGEKMGLLAAIQESLPARWVGETVAQVKRQAEEGDAPEIRRRARALLTKINNARNAVGKGNTEHLTPEEKRKSMRRAVSLSKAIRRLDSNYKRGMEEYHDHEKARREVEEKFNESGHIKDSHKRSLILQGFRRRIKVHEENLR